MRKKDIKMRLASVILSVLMILISIPNSRMKTVEAYSFLTYGIDVSNARGTINWDKVKNAGIDFAIIRAGYGDANAYPWQKDSCFDYNISNAKRVGIKCGVYWFCYATSVDAARKEADSCYNIIKGIDLDYPVYVDIEDESSHTLFNAFGHDKNKITEMTMAFCDRLASYGVKVGVYANTTWFNNYIDKNKIINNGYEVWLAHYPAANYAVDPTGYDKSTACGVWQYSDKAVVDGVPGNVDVDVSYKDYGKKTPDLPSRITITGQTVPSGLLKKGSFFGIYGNISSNLPISLVWGGVYKSDWTVTSQYTEARPNTNSYSLYPHFDNNIVFNELAEGTYHYLIKAKDTSGTEYTLINSEFSIGTPIVNSSMSISGQTAPSGSLQQGKFFAIKGIISSNLNITKVWGGVYNRGGSVTAQYAEASPNSTKYDLSTYFDNKIVFNNLAVGYYTYKIQAKDSSGKEYTLINSDFQIGNPKALEFNASTTSLNINKSKGLNKSITFSYKNAPVDHVSIEFVHGSNRVTNCTWQEWNNGSIDLDFEGYTDGVEILTVNLLNAANDEVLASKTITINVTSDEITVLFDVNGGNCSTASKSVTVGNTYGTLPIASRTGYTFNGWILGSSTSSVVSENSIVNKNTNHTLIATWIPNNYIVSFDINDGTGIIASKTVTYDKSIGDFPDIAVSSDYEFLGWYTEPDGGDVITPETKYTYESNLTLYAQVKEKIINPISTFVLSDTDVTLENGLQFHISASQDNLIYISHNTDIAVVSKEGTITAVGEGTAVITVSNSDGYEVLMIITVIPASNYIKGDVDGNGDFNIEDVALLQRWLLADPNAHLKKWEAGDLCKDDRLDVFDLCMMRRLLIGG